MSILSPNQLIHFLLHEATHVCKGFGKHNPNEHSGNCNTTLCYQPTISVHLKNVIVESLRTMRELAIKASEQSLLKLSWLIAPIQDTTAVGKTVAPPSVATAKLDFF